MVNDLLTPLFQRWLQAANADLKGHPKMNELVKLIALTLILTKDSVKLHHAIAECKKEARETKLGLRRILAHIVAITLASATLVFYGIELPSHAAHVSAYMA